MNEIINKESSSEFSPGYLRWLYSLTIVILLFVFFIQPEIKQAFHGESSILKPPDIFAAGEIVSYGIEEFQTGEIHPIDSNKRTSALISLLVFLVFAPTIVLFFNRKSPDEKSSEQKRYGIVKAFQTFAFLIGLVFVAIIYISTVGGSFISPSVFAHMKQDNAISEERDGLTTHLVDAYSHIVQYYYQTEQFGGTKKNIVRKNKDGSVQSITSLNVFGVNETEKFGTLFLEQASADSMITVHAIGNSVLNNNSFKNINNETGKSEYAMRIFPGIPSYVIKKIN